MKQLNTIPSLEDIEEAHKSIVNSIHRTPIMQCESLDEMTGCHLFFKCENFQKVGAFKMRGASCAVAALTDLDKQKGIATHSSGNHAQAVALSAKMNNIPAHIVMPENAPPIKRAAVLNYGATVHDSGPNITDREEMMEEVLKNTGATFIHPYDNYNIIAGQATAARELLEDQSDLDIIMAPVGGGGLMSGTGLITKYLFPGMTIYGAEPKIVDDAYRSFHSGNLEQNERIDTIADGLRTRLSQKTLSIITSTVDEILTVQEESIVRAMRLIWERMKIIVEPSGAVPLAAVLENPDLFQNRSVGLIISGGNVELNDLPFI